VTVVPEARQPRLEIGGLWRWSLFYLLDEKSGPPPTLYPDLEAEDVREALLFAAEAVRERTLRLAAGQ
jgi:hypothetical protein